MVTSANTRELMECGGGTALAEGQRMKLSLLFSLGLGLLLCTSSALAAPNDVPLEDALADGEIDSEDVVGRGTTGRTVLRTAPGGQTWVSLAGFSRTTITNEREIGGFVVLSVPFDRLTRPRARQVSFVDLPTPETPRPRGVPVVAASESGDLSLTPRLARASVAAAWRNAGIGSDDDRLDAIVSRARWSAVLPEARVRAVRFEDERLSADTGTDTARYRDSAGANIGFEARLTWRLDRILYADDEPSFERMRLERRDARSKIAGKVLEALFHWQRALLDLKTMPATAPQDRERLEASLRVLEAEAALDVLTGGFFSSVRSQRGTVTLPAAPTGADL